MTDEEKKDFRLMVDIAKRNLLLPNMPESFRSCQKVFLVALSAAKEGE